MYLLNPEATALSKRKESFTFHNVSIKSRRWEKKNAASGSFTFHNVSIKSMYYLLYRMFVLTLHSTMYLLNRALINANVVQDLTLHSTMYLLNLNDLNRSVLGVQNFTFHNVSIKSCSLEKKRSCNIYFTFHNVSIKSGAPGAERHEIFNFTFHNVSIKSRRSFRK